jgi:hypothetical protein
VVAFGVFVLLPGWVPDFDVTGDVTSDASESTPVPIDNPATPNQGNSPAEPPLESEPEPSAEPDPLPQARSAPASPPPARSIERPLASPVSTGDDDQAAFASAMAEGLARLDGGELEEAREAFESARALRPASAEAADGLARVDSAAQLIAIAEHRERARGFEDEEQWGRARAEYKAVLALDPTIRFALQGERRASGRQALSDRLDRHLDNPGRLSEEAVLADARETLEEAREVEAPGAALGEQIDRLQKAITVASRPIRVVLLSDGETNVLVYRVGELGTFERRELDLRPGKYTVVGTRAGYRDVRLELEVTPVGSPPLDVQCREKV